MLRNYREYKRLKIALNPPPLNFTPFLTNQQPTNQTAGGNVVGFVVPTNEHCLVPYSYVFGTRSTQPLVESRHHRAQHAKNTHASDSNGSRSARATHILQSSIVLVLSLFFSLEGQEAANHVLPQPCRRRCALRFLGQCLHVSFSDTASTDAIYLCACLEGASRPSSLRPRPAGGREGTTSSAFPITIRSCGRLALCSGQMQRPFVAESPVHAYTNLLSHLFIVPFFIFAKFCTCTCSVTPGSRGLAGAVNTRAPAVPALRMADVAETTEAAADPTVMRPPIDMPWESISDQVRRGHLIAAPSIELCNSRNSGMLLRYPRTT